MPILSLIFLIPLVACVVILAIPDRKPVAIKLVALLASLCTLLLSLYVFIRYDYKAGGFQFTEQYEWLKSAGVSLHVGVDGIGILMLLLTGVVIFCGVLVSWKIQKRVKDYFFLLLLLVSGVFGVFMSLDLFFLFFFYEVAVLPMYLLIGYWGSTSDFGTFKRTKEYSALKLTLYLVAGSVLVWIAIIGVYVVADAGTFDILGLQQVKISTQYQNLFFPFFVIGFGVLAGMWPFHTWSPDGHVAAPTAVSMLHAGVLMKLGAFGIIRVGMTVLPEGAVTWMPWIIILGTINVVYGAFSAMAQKDLKYVIGYSSVSHMGYVIMGLATLDVVGINGAVLQMFSHGIMTALFFALVGVIYDQAHTREIGIFSGLAKRMGTVAAFFTIAGLTSLGLPGLSGFVAEFLVFVGTFRTYPLLGILGIIGAAITAIYILRLLVKVFFGPLDTKWGKLIDANRSESVAMYILVFVIILVGGMPSFFMRVIGSGVQPLINRITGA